MATTTSAVGTATIGVLTNEDKTLYELAMLPRAIPPYSYLWVGQQAWNVNINLPENDGSTVQWNKLNALTVVSDALTEGITPEGLDVSITSDTGTVSEYGSLA